MRSAEIILEPFFSARLFVEWDSPEEHEAEDLYWRAQLMRELYS